MRHTLYRWEHRLRQLPVQPQPPVPHGFPPGPRPPHHHAGYSLQNSCYDTASRVKTWPSSPPTSTTVSATPRTWSSTRPRGMRYPRRAPTPVREGTLWVAPGLRVDLGLLRQHPVRGQQPAHRRPAAQLQPPGPADPAAGWASRGREPTAGPSLRQPSGRFFQTMPLSRLACQRHGHHLRVLAGRPVTYNRNYTGEAPFSLASTSRHRQGS